MKLWLLRIKEGTQFYDAWDTAQGYVIRAETEEKAREIADENRSVEWGFQRYDKEMRKFVTFHPWLDPQQSLCIEISAEGSESIILLDYRSG